MINKIAAIMAVLALLVGLCACGQGTNEQSMSGQAGSAEPTTWQEQYDLGLRFLSEGNYEEAIIAFTVAIEIDPKRALAYVGRGDAYVLSGETEATLTAAQADYEQAIVLDDTLVVAYLGLADIYIRCGNYDKALEILRLGQEKTNSNQKIVDKITEIESGNIMDSLGNVRLESIYDLDGVLHGTTEFQYNAHGWVNGWVNIGYDEDGTIYEIYYAVVEFGEDGYPCKNMYYNEDGTPYGMYDLITYNELGQEAEIDKYLTDGSWFKYKNYFDESGRMIRYEEYENGSECTGYWEYLYDETGAPIGTRHYDARGNLTNTTSFS